MTYRTKKVVVKGSPIEGLGVFASTDIRKGEVAFVAKGTLKKFKVNGPKDSEVGPNWLGIGEDLWLDPDTENPLTYINHSCDPNLGIRGKVSFTALRNIRKGEELTFDYSIAESDPLWRLPKKCKCGSRKCRGRIKSVQYLPEPVFKLYSPYMPEYFKRVYNTSHRGT